MEPAAQNSLIDESTDPVKLSRGRVPFGLAGWKAEIVPATNRVSLKVAEHERQLRLAQAQRKHKYMVAPDAMPRYIWDLLMALITILLMWRVPYTIAFGEGTSLHWKIFNKSTDLIYILDVLVNFRTGYNVDADVVMDPKKVAVRYMKSWFLIDLIGSIPFELFVGNHSSGIERKAIKASVKYMKIPKLFRIARIIKFVQKYMKYAYTVQCLGIYLSVIHWVACLWADHVFDLAAFENNEAVAYGEALHVSVMLLMDISSVPVVREDYFICAVLSIIGFVFQSITIASITSVIMGSSNRAVQYQEKVRMVMSDLKALQVPVELRKATKSYYETLWRMKNTSDRYEKAIYEDEDLSPALRSEIALHIHRSLIATVPLFQDCSDSCLACVVMKLRTQLYMRGDVIFHKGEPASSMAIVSRGKVKVISPDNGTLLAVLKQGCFFGEMGLLRNMTRSCTVISATFCELKSLMRKDVEEVFDLYPQIYERLFAESEKRRLDTRLKAKIYNVKVLDNAHAVDVSCMDEVPHDDGSTSPKPFIHGLSEAESSSGSKPKLIRMNSLNADDGAIFNELDNMNVNIEQLQRLLDSLRNAQAKLTKVHDKRHSLHQALSKSSQHLPPMPTMPSKPTSPSATPILDEIRTHTTSRIVVPALDGHGGEVTRVTTLPKLVSRSSRRDSMLDST
ncbi:hypothetical protein Poli38472_002929 [Pythium oligandrum]|uniref:Cyclic nucleotide-binding domain-containing protein n=1 Tax=Pythium oligandrum TaxID=41045 RepID=A0A8K1C5U3_PYTOL|nr:hypothetical protein Poli38472_002929 [Pythium oligandrum]|eukprot:TMW57004.1 hypothetical protein Poli38472_002929 [Pythium oligandrum]